MVERDVEVLSGSLVIGVALRRSGEIFQQHDGSELYMVSEELRDLLFS